MLFSVFPPSLKLDLFAPFQIALNAEKDVVERLVREVLLEDIVDLCSGDLAVLETHKCFTKHSTDNLGHLFCHSAIDLCFHFVFSLLKFFDCIRLLNLRFLLHVGSHFSESLA